MGETATVDDPDFGKGVHVSLDELFTSAKGEDCKRGTVLSGQREAEVIVICRDSKGHWNMFFWVAPVTGAAYWRKRPCVFWAYPHVFFTLPAKNPARFIRV